MPDLKISQLNTISLPSVDGDIIPIVRSGASETNKVSIGALLASYTGSMTVANSNFALTSSYALSGGTTPSLQDVLNVNNVGDTIELTNLNMKQGGNCLIAVDYIIADLVNIQDGSARLREMTAWNGRIDDLFTDYITVNTDAQFNCVLNANSGISGNLTGSVLGNADTATTASYVTILGDGITVNYSELGIELTGSIYTPDLQAVTTAGNTTSQSVVINSSLINGANCVSDGVWSHAEGLGSSANGAYTHAEGFLTTALNIGSHAEGDSTAALGRASHAEGLRSIAIGDYSHAEGEDCVSNGYASHTEGYATVANGLYSHAKGIYTIADGNYSYANGVNTFAKGGWSHTEGNSTTAIGNYAHSEGYLTTAVGDFSKAEGWSTVTIQQFSHAEGYLNTSIGIHSHAEGQSTTAIGTSCHTEGSLTTAIGAGSHAEGLGTISLGGVSHAQGQYNLPKSEQSSFVIGKGTNNTNRANILEVLPISNITNISSSLNLPDIVNHNYTNDVDAATAGIPLGGVYHHNGVLRIRHT